MPTNRGHNKKPSAVVKNSPTVVGEQEHGAQPIHTRGMRAELYQGSVPHPEHLERFEALQPGATNRFIRMAEQQETHRHSLENRAMTFHGASQMIGSIGALLIVLSGMGMGGFLVHEGRDIAGYVSMFLPLTGVAGAFLYGKKAQQKELDRKRSVRRQ